MGEQEKTREDLKSAALKMKYVLLALGIMPIFFVVLEVILALAIKPESLAEIRDIPSRTAILAVMALVAILSVTVEPWFVYRMIARGARGPQVNLGGVIIIRPCIATTATVMGFILFFIFNFYVTLIFHALSLLYVWHFNLGMESFLDRLAEDLGKPGGA